MKAKTSSKFNRVVEGLPVLILLRGTYPSKQKTIRSINNEKITLLTCSKLSLDFLVNRKSDRFFLYFNAKIKLKLKFVHINDDEVIIFRK